MPAKSTQPKPIFRMEPGQRGLALSGFRGRYVRVTIDIFRDGQRLEDVEGEAVGVTWMYGAGSQWGLTIETRPGHFGCYPGSRIRTIEIIERPVL